ncbi:DUF2712 domain-containing protein [Terrilactibacillus laevilacticus]|uniref:DUF2712 domain-containing protein n=1 Tax=Terrilactibacillus laevilacticus TaxID=1380157 RepID=A0ABW5PM39_9BACI|nr:DUF2712 domain-containing protein [Terrilactibacillus laevilacticus]
MTKITEKEKQYFIFLKKLSTLELVKKYFYDKEMVKLKRKKILFFILTLVLSLGVVGSFKAYAYDDNNISFSFTIKADQTNSDTGTQPRATTTRNTWKVHMYKSEEGTGTLTTYWLENKNNTNVSPAIDVKAGSGSTSSGGSYYVRADSGANNEDVKLTAENNNYSSHTYSVYGYWDEETGYILPGQYNTYHVR